MAVFCGQCGNEYATDNTYLAHTCKVTGYKPTEPESMGVNWDKILRAAIDRGASDSTPEKVQKAKQLVEERRKAK